MYRLIEFIRRSYVTILFVALEIVAISFYARSNYYTQARILARANAVTGDISNAFSNVGKYFSLGRENARLTERVAELEQELAMYRTAVADSVAIRDVAELQYEYMPARVVSNSINRNRNFITLNRGLRDGVTTDMAVLSPSGEPVGYILACSERYSVALSILNTSFRTGGKIAGDNYSGSIEWDGLDPHRVQMHELSKYADIKIGAEVVTSGYSHYFPADMPIGTVESFELDRSKTYYDAVIRLAVDISKLYNVVLVNNIGFGEAVQLEEEAEHKIYD